MKSFNSTFYILGTSPQINDITEEEWEFLKDNNTIGFGGFAFSNKKTKYNYSHEGKELDKMMLMMMAKNGYYDTVLFLYRLRSIELAMQMGFGQIVPIQKGSALLKRGIGWFMDEEYPSVKLKECFAHSFNEPLFRFRGSLSAVINTALILGAKEIRLIGIELDKLQDFYFDVDKWAKDNIERRMINAKLKKHKDGMEQKRVKRPYMYDDFDSSTMHTTAIPYKDKNRWGDRELRGMIDVLWWVNKELRELGHRGMYSTIDYKGNRLELKGIMDE